MFEMMLSHMLAYLQALNERISTKDFESSFFHELH